MAGRSLNLLERRPPARRELVAGQGTNAPNRRPALRLGRFPKRVAVFRLAELAAVWNFAAVFTPFLRCWSGGSFRRGLTFLLVGLSVAALRAEPPACDGAAVHFTPDYAYILGSAHFSSASGQAEAGSQFRWLTNGAALAAGPVAEGLLLNFDGVVTGVSGETPTAALNVAYAPGKWASALALPANGRLQFGRTNNLFLDQGTIELWVAPRADGTNAIFSSRTHTLFQYRAANGEYLQIAQSGSSGILYAGGTVSNQWESAYGGRGNMRSWRAGEWHHLAFTYSAAQNFMRFYVDGVLAAANNEGHYWPPAGSGAVFALGGDLSGNVANYWLDAVRCSGRVAEADEVLARSRRTDPASPNEIWLAATNVARGTSLVFEFAPATATQTGAVCQSAALLVTGLPLTNAQPPSTLLPAGATGLDFSVETITNTACAYAVGQPLPFAQMAPFAQGAGSTFHRTRIAGLNPDPNVVNDVFIRCAAFPDFVLRLQYRALSTVNPPFPRKGNLWGWGEWRPQGLPACAKTDLWLGASPPAAEIQELRRLNPHLRLLTSINAVENSGLPADYYLKDIHGNRIEVWPGSYRLNLTKPYVAEFQARFAYQTVLDTGMMADGVFFDNVMTTQSWQNHDIYGNPVQIDADEDGVADNAATFDAAWKAGVFHEIRTFRQFLPNAIVSGHSMNIYEPGIAELFNGLSVGFATANVLEGEESFSQLWAEYQEWFARAVPPVTMMIESSPMDQIAYGYDYSPEEKIPAATLEFARTYYPYVRFGLAFTLLGDGFFAHEYGDTWHGNAWWYEELDFNLGYPLGPARRLDLGGAAGTNSIVNGGFETAIAEPWRFYKSAGCTGTLTRETNGAAVGAACAKLVITATTGTDWHVEFAQYNRSLVKGAVYDLTFRARASAARPITLSAQKGSPDWRNYGLSKQVQLTSQWQEFTVSFEANETVSDARIQFFLGAVTGTVWLDGVSLSLHPPDVFRRDFTKGIVLLNGTRQTRDVPLEAGFRRLTGTNAAMHEMILDDLDAGFSSTGTWTNATYDSGEWMATGPFYHAWAKTLRERAADGEARWQLPIEADDTYTLAVWWPAAPAATNWTHSATYAVIAGGVVVAATNLDQTLTGDRWHEIATVRLSPTNAPYVRLTAPSGRCVADAVWLRSQARFNNGQPAASVRLQPLDGILLQRDTPVASPPRIRQARISADQMFLTVTNLTPGVITDLLQSTDLSASDWRSIQSFQPLQSETNLPVTISGDQRQAYYRFRVNP